MRFLTNIVLGILYLYNVPVLLAYLMVTACGIKIETHSGRELDNTSKIILLAIASIFSTAIYMSFPSFFQTRE